MRTAATALLVFAMAACVPRLAAQDTAMLVEDYRFGSFINASSIELDVFGSVLVSDAGAHRLSKFRPDGTPEQATGGQGWGPNQFDQPRGIDARLGIIVYVADKGNHRIVRLDRTLHALGSFSTQENPSRDAATSSDLSFGSPLDVVITKLENLAILDGDNARVVMTRGFASVDKSFGGIESGEGRLREPVAMARSDDDRLYVLESDRFVVFDSFGNFLFAGAYNIFEDAKGICYHKGRVAVVTPAGLYLFRADGTPEARWTRERFALAGGTAAFADVAMTDERIFLLTATTVLVFSQSP
jgi:hypothetical protein